MAESLMRLGLFKIWNGITMSRMGMMTDTKLRWQREHEMIAQPKHSLDDLR